MAKAKTKPRFEEAEHVSEVDSGQNVEILRPKCETTRINMLRILMEKGDHMQGQLSYISREMDIARKKSKNARHQNHCNTNEECLWWLISRRDTAEERISEREDLFVNRNFQNGKAKKKRKLKKGTTPENWGTITNGVTHAYEYWKEKGKEKIFEAIMTANVSKLMSDTKPQIWEAWE